MKLTFLKSLGAIFLGIIVIFVLSVGSDILCERFGIFPAPPEALPNLTLFFVLIYRMIYAVIGAYVAASLAPHHPLRHALALGLIGVLLSTFGAVYGWDLSQHWYPILLVVSSLPCAWVGGKLYQKRKRHSLIS